VRILWFHHQ